MEIKFRQKGEVHWGQPSHQIIAIGTSDEYRGDDEGVYDLTGFPVVRLGSKKSATLFAKVHDFIKSNPSFIGAIYGSYEYNNGWGDYLWLHPEVLPRVKTVRGTPIQKVEKTKLAVWTLNVGSSMRGMETIHILTWERLEVEQETAHLQKFPLPEGAVLLASASETNGRVWFPCPWYTGYNDETRRVYSIVGDYYVWPVQEAVEARYTHGDRRWASMVTASLKEGVLTVTYSGIGRYRYTEVHTTPLESFDKGQPVQMAFVSYKRQ